MGTRSDAWNDRIAGRLTSTRFTDVRHVAETGSTNADVLDAARHGAPEGLVVVADHQTAGRGRLGRTWQAPPRSSLLVSILLRPDLELDQVHLGATALGVAAVAACRDLGVPAGLKWPNDLVIDVGGGELRKVSGMLAESVVVGGRLEALVLGIGINVNWPAALPPDLADIAIALNHVTGVDLDRADVLVGMLEHFDRACTALQSATGRSELLAAYRARSATIGRRVEVDLGHERFVGDALDVNDDGQLLVIDDCPDRPRTVVAGDVVHLRQ